MNKRQTTFLAMSVIIFVMFSNIGHVLSGNTDVQGGQLMGWTFSLDPGHGGSDTGAVGPTGLTEKEINLKVAFFLKQLLEEEGAEVVMTRTTDVDVSLAERAAIANDARSDRHISIHHNATGNSTTNGTETFVHPSACEEARDLARHVQEELIFQLGLPNRGVKEANFHPLRETRMPAILTEASFMSNPEEEQRLRDDNYLFEQARAIFRAVLSHAQGFSVLVDDYEFFSGTYAYPTEVFSEYVRRIDLFIDGTLAAIAVPPNPLIIDTTIYEDGRHDVKVVFNYTSGYARERLVTAVFENTAKEWYFAEGYTGEMYETYITVLNPNSSAANVGIKYMTGKGEVVVKNYLIDGLSRFTVNVGNDAGLNEEVSIELTSDTVVFAERPIYFNHKGFIDGGHVVLGKNELSEKWIFAEGYTGEGFETWLCLMNPHDEIADVSIEYGFEGAEPVEKEYEILPNSRKSIFVNDEIGTGKNVSMNVNSDIGIAAERPMYFNYMGHTPGGTVDFGVTGDAKELYFAEGFTGEGFDTWLCLYNPGGEKALVEVDYMLSDGSTENVLYEVPSRQRFTVLVNEEIGKGKEFGIRVNCEDGITAERPMYFKYAKYGYRGGTGATGVAYPSRDWYFAEGYTGKGFDQWICVLNPNDYDVTIMTRFRTGCGYCVEAGQMVDAKSRVTINVRDFISEGREVSCEIHATGPVVAERAIYFSFTDPRQRWKNPWQGGHAAFGFANGVKR